MRQLLLKHKPDDTDEEKWKVHWENASWTLQPLADAIKELAAQARKVKREDFDCPNHYAKLAFEAGELAAYERILDLLPQSVEK